MKKTNIGIVTFPIGEAGSIATSNLVEILNSISNDTFLITGNRGYDFFKNDKNVTVYGIRHEIGANKLMRIIKYIHTQLKISYKLKKIAKNAEIWIFFIGGNTLVLPILTAKLLRKKVLLAFAGSTLQGFLSIESNLSKPIRILEGINRLLSDHIILYSPNLIKEWDLERYTNKIFLATRHFLDFDIFKIKKEFDKREKIIGYIGRLSEEKGVLNFVKAIPYATKKRDDLKFLVGGDGKLHDNIENYLNENNLKEKVKLTGWIPHDKLSNYLNELKLLVLPSYTEGLPNIMLEAMACGTPVLANPVGAIPDVIKNCETGFILKNNNSKEIAKDVLRIIEHPDLGIIAENAKSLVESKFTYDVAVEDYKRVLTDIVG